jgi:hypothetical protein
MRPTQRSGHVNDPSNQFGLDVFGRRRVTSMKRRLIQMIPGFQRREIPSLVGIWTPPSGLLQQV